MSCGLAKFNDGPGQYSVEKETFEGLLSVSYEAKKLYLPAGHVILTV